MQRKSSFSECYKVSISTNNVCKKPLSGNLSLPAIEDAQSELCEKSHIMCSLKLLVFVIYLN